MTIRPLAQSDLPALEKLLSSVDLFPAEMLAEMCAPYLADPQGDEVWCTALSGTDIAGFCFARQEALTKGTWNMLAIAVDPRLHGQRIGAALTIDLEVTLRTRGARLLIVDTSSTPGYAGARRFYTALGYEVAATIADYWDAGDDKVTFRKAL